MRDNNQALEQAESGFDSVVKEAEDFGKEVDKAGGKLKKVGEITANVGKVMVASMVAIDKTSQKIGISAESYRE